MKKKRPHQNTEISAGALLLSSDLQEEVLRFIEYHPPSRFSRNLRKMLLDYLMHESSLEDVYIKDLLYDIQGLFELLDAIEIDDTSDREEILRNN